MPPKVRHFWGHINARVGTLHFAFFRSLMRCQKKLLIRDFAVDFCFAKIAVSANHVFAAQKWFDYPTRPKQKHNPLETAKSLNHIDSGVFFVIRSYRE